jgi:hypothetical protein
MKLMYIKPEVEQKIENPKYNFSGHDTFQCRQLWLKKGFDYVQDGHSFNNADAVVKLGVDKIMVYLISVFMKTYKDNDKESTHFTLQKYKAHTQIVLDYPLQSFCSTHTS